MTATEFILLSSLLSNLNLFSSPFILSLKFENDADDDDEFQNFKQHQAIVTDCASKREGKTKREREKYKVLS